MTHFRNVLITGGAGFVGANLAVLLKQAFSGIRVTAVDSLKRRGSELNLPRLRAHGVDFHHGDVRAPEDLAYLPEFDLLIDCAAEPSVHAGVSGSPQYVVNTNLQGTFHCLEAARLRNAAFLLLSTSRVYPIPLLNGLPYREAATRFEWEPQGVVPGVSPRGVSEVCPLAGPRSFYGASKLACELLLQEYVHSYRMPGLINRCGVLTGPWQMGKVDQGVVSLWVARHCFHVPLAYRGFGGSGKQVRDILHVEDLFDLLVAQMARPSAWDGSVYNVGGGHEVSVSLLELTELCESVTGHQLAIETVPETSDVDLRIYVSDASKARQAFGWAPHRSVATIIQDIADWIEDHRELVEPMFR